MSNEKETQLQQLFSKFDNLIRPASIEATSIKALISGVSFSGKTESSLKMLSRLTGGYENILAINLSERNGVDNFAKLGKFQVLKLNPPYTPEMLATTVLYGVKKGFKGIIIDSLSAIWAGEGGVLEKVDQQDPKSNPWKKFTPELKKAMGMILDSPVHIFCTMRQKSDKVLIENEKGKKFYQKQGMKDDFKPDSDFDFDFVLEMNRSHEGFTHKDRPGVFPDNEWTSFDAIEIGDKLKEYYESGSVPAYMEVISRVRAGEVITKEDFEVWFKNKSVFASAGLKPSEKDKEGKRYWL